MTKKVSILGAGESGVGAALLAKSKGEEVFVSDNGNISDKYRIILNVNKIPYEEGGHNEHYILNSDLVIKSPGIPEKALLIKKLKEKGVPVISEIEYAGWYSRAKFIAITGSNGKTTTTLLTYHLLKELGINVGLAGNIGDSLARQVIEDKCDYYVLELSSFQLDDMYRFKADIAVLLNITPDHLDRYDYNFQNYVNSKFRIIQNMTPADYFITFTDDPVIEKELGGKTIAPAVLSVSLKEAGGSGAWVEGEKLNFRVGNKAFSVSSAGLPLKGKHNTINVMCSVLVAAILKQDPDKFEPALKTFKNAPHRLEYAGSINGVDFVNDSKATNVDSVWYALDSFERPVIWIAGGVDKGNDYTAIESLVKKKVKALVCMGKDNAKLLKAFKGVLDKIEETDAIDKAVEKAFDIAEPGDVILLSPACASFDLFKNYEDRGNQFKTVVKSLTENR